MGYQVWTQGGWVCISFRGPPLPLELKLYSKDSLDSILDRYASLPRWRCLGREPSTKVKSVDDEEILQQHVRERLYAVCGNESISFSDSRNVRSGCTSKRTVSTRAASYVCSHSKLEHNLLISSFPRTFKLVLTCRKPFSRIQQFSLRDMISRNLRI